MVTAYTNDILEQAKSIFNYLYLQDEISASDAVMGFGHFDLKIPACCGNLFSEGFAPLIIFSGGVGAGSTGLKRPEAMEFLDSLTHHFPSIPREKIIIEDKSTNTGENILFSMALLQNKISGFAGFEKLIIIANAYRQRRVWLTCKKYLRNTHLINCPPDTSFEAELELFGQKQEDLCMHLIQELYRIRTYPDKGFIEQVSIPGEILSIYEELKEKIQK